MIKVLFLAANPADTKPLAIGSEFRDITNEVRQAPGGRTFEIAVELAVRVTDIQRALLLHKPTIVHFAGHGRGAGGTSFGREFDEPLPDTMNEGILFENDSGRAVPVPVGALANLFRIVRNVECVVLCACHTAAQAEAIRQHVKFVVGMDRAILDASAIAFSVAFYRALAFGESIEVAFELGRNAIEFKGNSDSAVPILLPHDSVDAATWSLESRASNSTPFAMFSIPPRLQDIPERQSRPFDRRSDDEPERSFLKQVKRITKLRSPRAEIIPQWSPHPFLGVLNVESIEGSSLRVEFVVIIDQPMTMEILHEYRTKIEPHLRAQWHYAPVTLVHTGNAAPEEMRRSTERRAVFLKSFSEYQGLLDFTEYLGKQTRKLFDDPVYPHWLYVDQRAKWSYAGSLDEFHTDHLLDTLRKELDTPAQPRFIVVLGEFGVGKTFLLHELARRMVVEEHQLVPVLVQLSKLEKASSIKQLLAQHFAAADMGQYHYDGFQYMLEQGRIVLLFDGFDELALRLSYDRVMAHFKTIMTAAQGFAKIVLTSRRQHFLTDDEVKRELRIEAERVMGSRFFLIERFEKPQILQFLRNTLRNDEEAEARYRQLDAVKDLLGLSENPRMLGFIAKIDKQKLLDAELQGKDVTSAMLYQWLVDEWLDFEFKRANPTGAPRSVSRAGIDAAMSDLARHVWSQPEKTTHIDDVRSCVAATLQARGETAIDDSVLAQMFGSGSLLVRDADGEFQFMHRSVLEWLVARAAARELPESKDAGLLALDEMSALMADFFASMAGPREAYIWALEWIEQGTTPTIKKNALLVRQRVEKGWGRPTDVEIDIPVAQDWSGIDFRGQDLSHENFSNGIFQGADFRGATLVGANLSGADLSGAKLDRANLTGADLSWANLSGANLSFALLLGAKLSEVRGIEPALWRGAKLVGAKGLSNEQLKMFVVAGAAPVHLKRVTPMWAAPTAACTCVALDPAGDLLTAGFDDGTVRLFDASTGERLRVLAGHTNGVSSIAWSPDGKTIASSSWDRTVRLWNTTTGTTMCVLRAHTSGVLSVAWSPDGEIIASASWDKTIRLWDVATGRCLELLQGHSRGVSSVVWNPDGETIASASDDTTIRIWSSTGRLIRTLEGHADRIACVAWSSDGKLLASGSDDNTIRLWSIISGRMIRALEGHGDRVSCIAWSCDGILASGSADKVVRIWDIATGTALRMLEGHTNWILSVAWSLDGKTVTSGAQDHTVRIWEITTGRTLRILEGQTNGAMCVAWSPDGKTLVSGSVDKRVRLWDAASGRSISFEGHTNWVSSVAWSPDGMTIASGSLDKTIRLWDAGADLSRRTLRGHANGVMTVAWSPDGSALASGSLDKTVRIWNVESGHSQILEGHSNRVLSVSWRSDGKVLASGGHDKTIRLWDIASGCASSILEGHANSVTCVAWRRDGRIIASGSGDNTVRLWDVASGRTASILEGHTNRITSVAWRPDGSGLATGSLDATVRLWSTHGDSPRVLEGHTNAVSNIAWSPDGKMIASSSRDGTIYLWSVERERCFAIFMATRSGWIAFTPDGRYKLEGDVAGSFWHVVGLCRFELGELDLRLPIDARLHDLQEPPNSIAINSTI